MIDIEVTKTSRKRMISYRVDDEDGISLHSAISVLSLDSDMEKPSEMVSGYTTEGTIVDPFYCVSVSSSQYCPPS